MDNSNYQLNKFVNPTRLLPAQLCAVVFSRGEIVKKVVDESGYSITGLAKRIHISRAQLYLDFQNPQMPYDRILAIGKVLGHDFSSQFRELPAALVSVVNQEPAPYVRELAECRDRLVQTQGELIAALHLLDRYKQRYGTDLPA